MENSNPVENRDSNVRGRLFRYWLLLFTLTLELYICLIANEKWNQAARPWVSAIIIYVHIMLLSLLCFHIRKKFIAALEPRDKEDFTILLICFPVCAWMFSVLFCQTAIYASLAFII